MEEHLTQIEVKKIDEYGFFVHVTPWDDRCSPTGYNAHTHGLDRLNHLDLQIVIPMHMQKAYDIFESLYNLIKSGTVFKVQERYSGIFAKCEITFIEAFENGRKVLRLILPDRTGSLGPVFLDRTFDLQYEVDEKC